MAKEKICEFEQKIVKEFASQKANQELSVHAANCPNCREALKVAAWMQAFARAESQLPALPTSGFLWWKAQIIQKQTAAQRATQPLVWAQVIAFALAAAAFAGILIIIPEQFASVWKYFSESLELVAAPLLISFLCGGIIFLLLAYKSLEPFKKK